jgi:hypothetical protein
MMYLRELPTIMQEWQAAMSTLVNRFIVTSSGEPLSAVTSTTKYVMQERRAAMVKSGKPLYDTIYTNHDAMQERRAAIVKSDNPLSDVTWTNFILCKNGGPLYSRAASRYFIQKQRTIGRRTTVT